MSCPIHLTEPAEAHAARLRTLNLKIPPHCPTAVQNEIDNGIAFWIPPGKYPFASGALSPNGFYLDRFPVTNTQYATFVSATGHQPPSCKFNQTRNWNRWEDGKPPEGFELHPVVGVSFHDAEAYCIWSGKRLPTETEWETAARGGLPDTKFPWGNDPDPKKANYRYIRLDGTTPITTYEPNGYGLHDMAGNTYEWCANPYATSPSPSEAPMRTLRGGSWLTRAHRAQCAARMAAPPSTRNWHIGFRCASSF
ncbi:MAG: SUMF1/EgtB/PvdO family nonheme iron enzyme [bacterium]|nr:SUMF1/EgtB/PvdO family nonheme iron enzyme [bacterium]